MELSKPDLNLDTGLPLNSPYPFLSNEDLQLILVARKIITQEQLIPLTRQDLINRLNQEDEKNPKWIDNIKRKDLNQLIISEPIGIRIYGAIHQISYIGMETSTTNYFIYTQILISLKKGEKVGDHIKTVSESLIKKIAAQLGISKELIEIISPENLRSRISNNNFNFDPDIYQPRIKRYHAIINNQYQFYIRKLYNVKSRICEIFQKPQHELEDVILSLDTYNQEQQKALIDKYEIIIPHKRKNMINLYLAETLADYRYVTGRKSKPVLSLGNKANIVESQLKTMTDREIINLFSAFVPFGSRRELINNCLSLLRNPNFFIPTKRIKSYIINRETISGSDVLEPSLFTIAYGTIDNYYLYEVGDLTGRFQNSYGDNYFVFLHPEDNSAFQHDKIIHLIYLLNMYPDKPQLTQLLEIIHLMFKNIAILNNNDQGVRILIDNFKTDEKQLLRNFFYQIFICSMYMRRWKGPGFPYNLKASETYGSDDPREKVSVEIVKTCQIHDKISSNLALNSIIDKLNIYTAVEYGYGTQFQKIGRTLMSIWNLIIRDQYCIRMASGDLAISCYYYLKMFFDEVIPNFDPLLIEKIA